QSDDLLDGFVNPDRARELADDAFREVLGLEVLLGLKVERYYLLVAKRLAPHRRHFLYPQNAKNRDTPLFLVIRVPCMLLLFLTPLLGMLERLLDRLLHPLIFFFALRGR